MIATLTSRGSMATSSSVPRSALGLLLSVDLVDRQEKRLAAANQLAGEVDIGGGEFGAPIHDHDDGVCFFERDLGLAINLRRHEIFFFGNNAASIYHAQAVATPFPLSIETIASDAGLVADDGAPRTYDSIEERGLADVGASDNRQRRYPGGDGCSGWRVVGGAGQSQRRTGESPVATWSVELL